ncbi:MAG: HpcH/HpaI aldolase/citrate lyase family protein [Candidatus Dormibacteraceae bacterium]
MRRRRSILSVPGSEARFHEKAAQAPADEVMFDLEDSVAPAAKERARRLVVTALRTHSYEGKVRSVRINSCASPHCHQDVIHIVSEARRGSASLIDCLVVPKVEEPAHVHFVDLLLGQLEAKLQLTSRIGLELQIESARGLEAVGAISRSSPRIEALVFGPGDFAASLGLPTLEVGGGGEGGEGGRGFAPDFWLPFLARMLVSARAGGLQAIDGPYGGIGDLDGLRSLAAAAARLGYDGKWALNPAQAAVLNEVFTPSPEALDRAREILAAHRQAVDDASAGALRLGDEMIDEASRQLAQAMVERAEG